MHAQATSEHRSPSLAPPVLDAAQIPALSHDEAARMAFAEYVQFLAVIESLGADDWTKPTACTLWNVRQLLAHAAGAAAGYTSWSEFNHQWSPWSQRAYRRHGYSFLDALNQIQVDDRADATPAELIAELRVVVPRAIATRRRLPAWLRALRIPFPIAGLSRLDYLTDLIYTRDMWIHRLDLCRATGRVMVLSPEHDGRIVALELRDLARQLQRKRPAVTLVYELSGPAGGAWRIGSSTVPDATIRMDTLDFNLLASGRMTPDDARGLRATTLSGDPEIAGWTLEQTQIVY
jgi:uncharacterized protein (TIGR03083 family)